MLWLNKMWNTYILVIPVRQHRHTYIVHSCACYVLSGGGDDISAYSCVCASWGGGRQDGFSVISAYSSVCGGGREGGCTSANGVSSCMWREGHMVGERQTETEEKRVKLFLLCCTLGVLQDMVRLLLYSWLIYVCMYVCMYGSFKVVSRYTHRH